MKTAFIVAGVLLIAVGVLSFVNEGVTYTTREEVIDIGPVQASTETSKTIPLPPVLGGLALAGGTALLVAGAGPAKTCLSQAVSPRQRWVVCDEETNLIQIWR